MADDRLVVVPGEPCAHLSGGLFQPAWSGGLVQVDVQVVGRGPLPRVLVVPGHPRQRGDQLREAAGVAGQLDELGEQLGTFGGGRRTNKGVGGYECLHGDYHTIETGNVRKGLRTGKALLEEAPLDYNDAGGTRPIAGRALITARLPSSSSTPTTSLMWPLANSNVTGG